MCAKCYNLQMPIRVWSCGIIFRVQTYVEKLDMLVDNDKIRTYSNIISKTEALKQSKQTTLADSFLL